MNTNKKEVKELSVAEQKKFQEFLTQETQAKEKKERLEYLRDHLQGLKTYFILNTIIFVACLVTAIYKERTGQDFGIFVVGVVVTFIFYVLIPLGFYSTKKEIKILEKQKP